MKKLFFFAAFLCAASLTTVNAQSCSKKTGAKTACCAKTKAATAKAVSADSSIEKRVCEKSGAVSYYKNYVCSESGKMTSTEVSFDAKTNTFVNVSPTRAAMPAADSADAKTCTKAQKANCTKAEKAACAKTCTKAEKAACAKKCAKGASTKQANNDIKAAAPAKATLMKGESN